MLRRHTLSWLVICAVLLSSLAPAFPVAASPLRQGDIADRIAEIRSNAPDLEDDFSDANSLFDVGYEGSTVSYFKSGELRIAVDDENTLAWSTMKREVIDYYVEVEAIQREGSLDNQFGILARLDEEGNYYLFAASSDGYYTIQARVDGEWDSLVEWTESEAIEVGEGQRNTLGLLVEGDTFTLLINDNIVDSITDDDINGTALALNAAAFSEPPIDIAFDNFRLWYIGEPIQPAPRQAPVDARNVTPRPEASATPTAAVTEEPTPEITVTSPDEPTPEPAEEATTEPTEEATEEPTATPTAEATVTVGTSTDPRIAAIQGLPPTFRDDFEDGDVSDWVHFDSDAVVYELVEGSLEFIFNASNVLTWSEVPIAPANFYIEVDATVNSPVDAAEYGIIFNYEDPQNFYLFAVNNASRYSVWRLMNNSWEVVSDWEDSSALLSGEGNTNRLGLLVQGSTIILTANDEVLAELEHSDGALGGIALAAGTFEEALLVMSFDNVALWDLDEVESLPIDEATPEPTSEPTAEPTDEANSDQFATIEERIEEITAAEPDLVDDFRRDTGTWDTQSHDYGGYFYESRAFHIESYSEERIIWSAYYENETVVDPIEFENFYVEFDTAFVTRTGENAAGLLFRLIGSDNFYKFMLDEVGYYQLQKRINGEYIDLISWTPTEAADDSEGAVNRIGILAEGATIAITVNGTLIGLVEDSDLATGAIALAIQTYSTPEGHSTFDNFELWLLDE